jgi:glycosyltransferase involved in cell wall biosynthesis
VEFPFHSRGQLRLNLCMLGPLAVRRQIVVVHDATVRARPSTFAARFRAVYNFMIPRLCQRARCAVTVSEFSRREIGKWYDVDVANMPVCFEGGDHITKFPPDSSVIDRLGLTDRKFFLCVGMGNNKNPETSLAAFAKAALPGTLLVFTGSRARRVNGPDNKMPSDGLRYVGYVPDSELRALYEHALALVFPSHYEGFGLPPVEAMTCGCPVIISEQPALVEVAGDAALRCKADDAEELARLMRVVHGEPRRRDALIAAGRARAARFTWQSTARVLLDLCLQVISTERAAAPVNRIVPRARESF